jgi:hypothetical protein
MWAKALLPVRTKLRRSLVAALRPTETKLRMRAKALLSIVPHRGWTLRAALWTLWSTEPEPRMRAEALLSIRTKLRRSLVAALWSTETELRTLAEALLSVAPKRRRSLVIGLWPVEAEPRTRAAAHLSIAIKRAWSITFLALRRGRQLAIAVARRLLRAWAAGLHVPIAAWRRHVMRRPHFPRWWFPARRAILGSCDLARQSPKDGDCRYGDKKSQHWHHSYLL